MTNTIKTLIAKVKSNENYVPRDYQTIGGMWTVDTWKLGDVSVKLMDEGYTTVVTAPNLKIVVGYNGKEYVNFEIGNEELVEKILQSLTECFPQ